MGPDAGVRESLSAPALSLVTAPATTEWVVREMARINMRLDKIEFLMDRGTGGIPMGKLLRMLDLEDKRLRRLETIATRLGIKF